MFLSKADAGWKEKLSSAGFSYCLKENDFDHDTQLWAYNPKTNQTEYLERNASICKGLNYSENSISGYLSNGNFWSWRGYGSLICTSGSLMGAKAKGKPYCHGVHKLNSISDKKKSVTPSNSSTEVSSLKKIENKCTELGFTKGREKHGGCVMKLHEG